MSVAAADSARRGSRSDPEAFFERVLAAFDEAVRLAGGSLERTFRVGPGVLKLLFAGEELADSVAPPFEPLEVMRDAPAAWRLTISLFHGANGRVRLPRAPWSAGDYDGRGEITGFNNARWQTILDPARGGLRMLDRQMSRGAYFVPSAAEVPSQGWTMPLCSLIGGWVRDLPLQLIHAGAVGTARGGVLITGKGGSGKSTTAAACLGSGLGLAGDDLVLVDMAGDLVVHSLLSTVKLEPSALARLPYLEKGTGHLFGANTLIRLMCDFKSWQVAGSARWS